MPENYKEQDAQTIFALDVGTRSVIGMLGRVEGERLHIFSIEKEVHIRRAMTDGQIEDIEQVARLARVVLRRLVQKNGIRLRRVCVAAAGRALRTERAGFALDFDAPRLIDEDLIGQLEAGAVSEADAILSRDSNAAQRLYLVGYTVSEYRLDGYPMSTLKEHSGSRIEADVVATFLPSEVVESLYAVMDKLELEVASLTLEPIASLNAAIPAEIRLLNLVLADIGAGTSDIAICRDGSVVGYTMATVAGDEMTELLMRELLVDFETAERLKLSTEQNELYTDVLGMEHEISRTALTQILEPSARLLAEEIAARITEINGAPPSAVFLAGGGSKLEGLQSLVAESLQMNASRVAIAGNNFEKSAFSHEYDLNDPEYATPLGMVVSAGLGLIHDSYVITLNDAPAKLFRSGVLVVRDILLMNGYTYADIIGRTGKSLMVTVDGQKLVFRGEPATPPVLSLSGKPATLSAVVHAGDAIQFTPAKPGSNAARTLAQLVGEDFRGLVTVNGQEMPLSASVRSGDVIVTLPQSAPAAPEDSPTSQTDPAVPENSPAPQADPAAPEGSPAPQTDPAAPEGSPAPQTDPAAPEGSPAPQTDPAAPEQSPAPPEAAPLYIFLNGRLLELPPKAENTPYYLMDLLQYSGLDFDQPEGPVALRVNGAEGRFSQLLQDRDHVTIQYEGHMRPASD